MACGAKAPYVALQFCAFLFSLLFLFFFLCDLFLTSGASEADACSPGPSFQLAPKGAGGACCRKWCHQAPKSNAKRIYTLLVPIYFGPCLPTGRQAPEPLPSAPVPPINGGTRRRHPSGATFGVPPEEAPGD